MSLPPQVIRVKRKATEDEPVSFLRVQQPKRLTTEAFVYQRQRQDAPFADIPSPILNRPIIHTRESRSTGSAAFQSPKSPNTAGDEREHVGQATSTTSPGVDGPSSPTTAEPRRFHMSRDAMLAASNYPTHRGFGGVSKKRATPTLFVERRSKRLTPTHAPQGIEGQLGSPAPVEAEDAVTPSPAGPEEMAEDGAAVESRRRKKPGLAREAQGRKGDDTPKKAELPASMSSRWNVDMDQLTADMNAFAMEQIALNLQRIEQEKQKEKERQTKQAQSPLKPHTPSRFKPKPPAKRYAERHPEEQTPAAPVDKEMRDVDEIMASDSDDDDYIIETYVRVPASTMDMQRVLPQNVGLLVFDAEPDLEFFYGDHSDSEDEWAEDDEDENAENYYTADYPDEEVASDDEFGYNAYAYRTGNASDLEEFDVEGFQESPDDSDNQDGFKSYIGRDGRVTKHL